MTDHDKTLIDTYDLEIFTPPCEPGAERYSAIAHLVGGISQVLPYLNVELSGAVYRSAANVLTWKRRAEITPDTTSRQQPAPMTVYKLLPGTNCKQCGEATCWVYAFKLAGSQKIFRIVLPFMNHSMQTNCKPWRRSLLNRQQLID